MFKNKEKFAYLPDGTIDASSWFEQMQSFYPYLVPSDLIKKAIALAEGSAQGMTTFYGQPSFEQGLEMAQVLFEMQVDQYVVAAAIITSTLQHTSLSIEIIQENLGNEVKRLVEGVLQMNVLNTLQPKNNKNRNSTQIDRLRKIFLAMVSDIRVVLIKLAERLIIMRGVKNINAEERKLVAQETLDIYAPLANRLGIGQIKWELEDLAFHYTEPETYKKIANYLAEKRINREDRIEKTIARLEEHLKNAHLDAKITGRAKNIYSIYLKMQRKHLDYKDIYDYSAVRILVPKKEDCFTALGIIHNLFESIPEEFDDYISNPKPNGYQSIHTAVVGPDNKPVEIQIRSVDMHNEAEHGLAAHWIYKEKTPELSGYEAKITFLRQLLAWHKDVLATNKTANDPFFEILEDRVYVFTPANEIIDLPVGATPLDFAYHIHTELGHRCRGAKIHGHIVPLTYQLKTGDQIEIISVPNGTPSRDWLIKGSGYLATSRARAKVSSWFKQQDVNQYVDIGKNHLEKDLTRLGIHHPNVEKLANYFNFKTTDSFYISLAHGNIRTNQILAALQSEKAVEHKPIPIPHKVSTTASPRALQIYGVSDLLMRMSKCCKPIPGDDIIGYITQGRGVSIHRRNCKNILNNMHNADNRLIEVNWDQKIPGSYFVDLQLRASGQYDLLKEISSTLVGLKVELLSLNSTNNQKQNMIVIFMTVQIKEISQLNELIKQLGQLPQVIDIKRMNR